MGLRRTSLALLQRSDPVASVVAFNLAQYSMCQTQARGVNHRIAVPERIPDALFTRWRPANRSLRATRRHRRAEGDGTRARQRIAREKTRRRCLHQHVAMLREQLSGCTIEIERLKLLIAKLKRLQYGRRSENLDRQIEQLEFKLEELPEHLK